MCAHTHGVEVIEDLVHADNLVIQLIVTVGVREEGIPICDEQIEDIYDLEQILRCII